MVASTLTHQPDPAIPNIVCPQCGLRMQVAAIEPAGNQDRTVTFGCACSAQARADNACQVTGLQPARTETLG